MTMTHINAPTQYIEVEGDRFAYRRWGCGIGTPMVLIQHFSGGLDHWDPLLTDGLAGGAMSILVNGRGVASSSGTPRNRIEDMADDLAEVIEAMGLSEVDVLGFSLGGYRGSRRRSQASGPGAKADLVGTGPRGGDPRWILKSWKWPLDRYRRWTTSCSCSSVRRRPRNRPAGTSGAVATSPRSGSAELPRSCRHRSRRSAIGSLHCRPDAPFAHLREIEQPTLVVNGTQDVMIATINSWHLGQNIPNAQLIVYPDAGHGAQFQYPERFLRHLTQFLDE